MNRISLSLLLLCLTAAASAQSLFEQYARKLTEPRSYAVRRANSKIKIDGKLNDAAWMKTASTVKFSDISGPGFPEPKYETTAKMLWDDEYLYVGARLAEPDIRGYLTQRDTIIYRDNDFEVFIDPDGDGMNYFEIEVNAKATVMDLLMNRPYRTGGNFLMSWNCDGLKVAVHHDGTLNKAGDTDRAWSVEMAIPAKALTIGFDSPLRAGAWWRLNFSRVEWLKKEGPEENWVWCPTGAIDMHMPERWGFVYFDDAPAGAKTGTPPPPYNMAAYRLVWAMYYAQRDNYAKERNYLRDVRRFFLTDKETGGLPQGAQIGVEASASSFEVSVSVPEEGVRYVVDEEGRFSKRPIAKRTVKNWCWTNLERYETAEEWRQWFKELKACGISAVLFEGYDEGLYKDCHDAGLEAHHWKWTMNRREVMQTHPDWFAVNRKGESCFDHPAYVEYYRFLCPYHEGVKEYLAADYVEEAHRPYVDGVHLDYVRMPDVVLPTSLWSNYGIVQTQELPEYDFCYCDVCRSMFKAQTGRDPLEVKYPSEDQSWLNFRLDGIKQVVDAITRAVKADHKFISAAVFPGPSMARKMVRQDWGNWSLDAYFPMIYNGFYWEGTEWIGRSTAESVQAVSGRAKVYPGLMFPDIKGGDFEKALDAAYGAGAAGVSFFDGPDSEHLKRFKKYLDDHGYVVEGGSRK